MAEEETSKRTRKSPQERRAEVLDAAVQLISERGFNGISIQDVADRVGISKQGVLRYVENKDTMLALVFDEYYGQTGTPEDFFSSSMPGSDPSAPHFPAYLRYLVKHNSRRRMMVQLFTVLSAESLNPDHPLHDEFMERMDGHLGTLFEIPMGGSAAIGHMGRQHAAGGAQSHGNHGWHPAVVAARTGSRLVRRMGRNGEPAVSRTIVGLLSLIPADDPHMMIRT